MSDTAQTRKNRIEHLESENRALKEQNRMLLEELDRLRSHTEWLTRQVFGATSERSCRVLRDSCQISLFGEDAAGKAEDEKPRENLREVKSHGRRQRTKPSIEELKKVLDVETVTIPLEDDRKTCPKCGSAMQPVGKELVRSELVREQPKVYIREIYRETFACRDASHEEPVFAKAAVPPSVIAHSLASASTVAYVMEQKYRYAKTFYRMEQEWHDLGVSISRQTMSNWVMLAANAWLQPILERMKPVLLARAIVHADETTFPLLPENGNDKHRTEICYAWVYTTGSYEREIRMAIYEYQPGRSSEYVRKFLAGYHGALQTDGYAGYNDLPVRLHALCWAHARRKFVYALPEAERKHPEKSTKIAGEAIRQMAKLFEIEEELKDLSPEERSKERLQRELQKNLALRVEKGENFDSWIVSGRGVLHLSVLIETMRREGYELQVGQPQVIYKTIDGQRCEPIEELTINVPEEFSSKIIDMITRRKGEMTAMETQGDRVNIAFDIPSRGIIGLRTNILTASQGEAIMAHRYKEYQPYKGDMERRVNGSLVASESGTVYAYALDKLQDRGRFFISPQDQVYSGQVVGEHIHENDLVIVLEVREVFRVIEL